MPSIDQTETDLRGLPRWAWVAFAARCTRLVYAKYLESPFSAYATKAVEQAIAFAENLAADKTLRDSVLEEAQKYVGKAAMDTQDRALDEEDPQEMHQNAADAASAANTALAAARAASKRDDL